MAHPVESAADVPWSDPPTHPVAALENCRARRKQRLAHAVGIDQFGVNRVELDPGVWSTVRHWHSHEDEFILIVDGAPTLVTDAGERTLAPGDCVGFKAGVADAHRLENRTGAVVVYLEVGSNRPAEDEVVYPDDDLEIRVQPDGTRAFQRRDGTVLGPAD
jgi:uncharacterized cupin superfamily protein